MKRAYTFCRLVLAVIMVAGLLAGCGGAAAPQSKPASSIAPAETSLPLSKSVPQPQSFSAEDRYVNVEITMQDGGVMKLQLDREAAPITVENFVKLVDENFYDGLTFHRIISGFMIQGGDPNGTGSGGPGYSIKGEFKSNGWDNPIAHTRGVISMARSSHPDSAGSQFFIMHADAPHLDGEYAAFGQLTEGFEVLDAIANTEVDGETPVNPQIIKSIRIIEE